MNLAIFPKNALMIWSGIPSLACVEPPHMGINGMDAHFRPQKTT